MKNANAHGLAAIQAVGILLIVSGCSPQTPDVEPPAAGGGAA
ncbi:MAG: hypothetical protein ACJ0SL_01885 [Candidatus Rariloculaceae bacterium]